MRPRALATLAALTLGGALTVAIISCSSVPRIAASGRVANYAFDGPVDSALARDYLQGRALPPQLEQVRRRYLAAERAPSRDALAQLSREYSPDVATLLWLETLSTRTDVRELRQRYDAELAHVRRVGIDAARPDLPPDLILLMVPGWFYRTHGSTTNADYRIQRALLERWGIAHHLIPIDENGRVEDNARIVANAVRKTSIDRRVFMVSASKSGAEVALALGRELRPEETTSVVGWLSLVGVVRGSPLADRVLEPDLCWFVELKLGLEGFDLEGASSMQTARSRSAFDGLHFPPHVRIFSYMAVPLSGDITDRGSFGYGRMREQGPNDGLTLLADELIPNAVPLLVPGVDHFLDPDQPEVWSTALFRLFAAEIRSASLIE